LLKRLFDDKNYYERCRTQQKNLGARGHSAVFRPEWLLALVKSIAKQLFSRGGWEYAKYMSETVANNPGFFPEAVTQAIKLDHFKTLTRVTLEADRYHTYLEGVLEQFKEYANRISSEYQELRKSAELVRREASIILANAESKYERLHDDFKRDGAAALEELRQRLREEIDKHTAGQGLGAT
jgi:hypothetical protein